MRLGAIVVCVVCLLPSAYAAEQCGALANAYGPFDYRTDKDKLVVVETHHFDSGVETLTRGMCAGGRTVCLGGDMDYTLRAFPNHHRALISMSRLGEKLKTNKAPTAIYTVGCYFDRAIRFRPDDGTVRMIYANYLSKQGKPSEALQQMAVAEKILGDNANLHYNMGLTYLDLKDYDKALMHAHRAYQLGFPLPGLRNRLERAGKWREPQKPQPSNSESTLSSDRAQATDKE